MKVTFFSNVLNHLQIPFCNELYKYYGNDFTFVSTAKLTVEMQHNGYLDCSKYVYNLNSYTDDFHYNKALNLGLNSDIVIIGSAPEIFIKERLLLNKLTFRYSERLLKKGVWTLFDPRVLFSLLRYHTQYRNKNLYMLCASAYTPNDLNWIMAYPKKRFKWGYFTEVQEIDIEQVVSQKPLERLEIIWTARFISWKHPELAVKLALELKKKGYNFHLNMIGTGNMFNYIKNLIKKLNVSENVSLLGSIPNSEVRSYMQKSNIFIITSDRNEGWGAVLNEAMSSGCAVIASGAIGAAPYLIDYKKNGLIFKSGSLASLLKQSESLFQDQSFRNRLSINAYYTLFNEWSPSKAASNFIKLSNSLLNNKNCIFENGPCSLAEKL